MSCFRSRSAATFLAAMLAGVVAVAAAEPAATPSNTVSATRRVRVTWQPGTPKPDLTGVTLRLYSPAVAGKIGHELLGIPPDAAVQAIRRGGAFKEDEAEVHFTVLIDPAAGARPAAREFADRLVGALESILAGQLEERTIPRLRRAQEEAERAGEAYEKTRLQLRAAQAEMGKVAGRADASPDSLRAAVTKLEDERQRLELDVAGMEARQKALEEAIARTAKQFEARAQDDPVVAELEKGVKALEKYVELTRQQFDNGRVSATAVAEAEAKLAESRVQYLDRKRGAAGAGAGAAGDPLSNLNRDLENISIEMVDRKARLEYVRNRLVPLREASELVPQVETLADELPRVRREVEESREELRDARRRAEETPRPQVMVIESKDVPK